MVTSVRVVVLYISTLSVIGVFIITILYKYFCSKKTIRILVHRCSSLQVEINQLKELFKKKEQEIAKVRLNLKQVKEKGSQQIAFVESMVSGVHVYINILQNQNLSQLKIKELFNFITFYMQIDTDFSSWIAERKELLTQREIHICILIRMGKEKQDIINLLRCSDGAYRTLKNRVKSKLCKSI